MAKKRRTLKESRAAQSKKPSTAAAREFVAGAARGKKAKKATKKVRRTREAQLATRIHRDLAETLRAVCKKREGKRAQPWRIGDVIEQALTDWLDTIAKRTGLPKK